MTRTTIIAALAAAVATTGTIAFPAYAAETSPTAEVRYADLDLASADGAQALKVRVERAAKRVCSVSGDRSLRSVSEARACTTVTMAKAMPQVELALSKAGTQYAEAGRVTVAAH